MTTLNADVICARVSNDSATETSLCHSLNLEFKSMRHSSRSQPPSAISVSCKIAVITLLLVILASCSSHPLNQANPEQISADVVVNQTRDLIHVEVTLRTPGQRGWLKPEPMELSAIDAQGQRWMPSSPNRSGASSFQLDPKQGPFELQVLDVIQQPIPVLLTPKILLHAPMHRPWQATDTIRLHIAQAAELQHSARWVLRCGTEQRGFSAALAPLQTDLEINLSTLWQQFEQSLGARLTGVAHIDLEIYYEPQIVTVPGVRSMQWRQLWHYPTQLQSPRAGAQLSGAIRLGTPNLSLGVQSTQVKDCR